MGPKTWFAAGAAGAAALAWRGYRNALDVRVERVTLAPPRLPAALTGLRLLLLSDLHLPGVASASVRLARIVRDLEVDLVLVAGDLVENQAGAEVAVEALGALARRWPTYAVFGSHDHYEPRLTLANLPKAYWPINDAAPFRAELERRGVRVLHNEREVVVVRRAAFDLVGLADRHLAADDLEAALGNRPAEHVGVVLAHSPDVLPDVAARGLPLLLAGHTHGGQVAFPLIGAPVTHSRVYRGRQPAGERREGSTVAYVGRGFGTTGLPLRFNARPEVTVVTLARGGASA